MKALFFISIQLSEMHGTGRVKICFSFFFAYEVLKQQISFILKKEAFTEKSSETSTLLIEKQAI